MIDDNWTVLPSNEDSSVNFTHASRSGGIFEARYVSRDPSYFVAYLSAQAGCKKACRFCHLTATGQTNDEDASVEELIAQAGKIFEHYRTINGNTKSVNFNFMARGEPLASKVILTEFSKVYWKLLELANKFNLTAHFNISTIMPETMADKRLLDLFDYHFVTFYYSMYSVNPAFRKRWLPKSLDPYLALAQLAEWQHLSEIRGQEVVIHYTFIENENDSVEDVKKIINAIKMFFLKVRFNLVRYNPFSESHGRESSQEVIDRNIQILQNSLGKKNVKIISRVGFDINASCGMFVSEHL